MFLTESIVFSSESVFTVRFTLLGGNVTLHLSYCIACANL